MVIVPKPEELLGQERLVAHFGALLQAKQLPHALLLTGEEGSEALPLAFVLSRQILCENRTEEGLPCGVCQSCRQMDGLQHPDLTMVFPVIKSGDTKETTSDLYLDQFTQLMSKAKRFSELEWRDLQSAGNKQLQILVAEAERLIHFTSLRSFKSQYQVIIIWKPELMRSETANKLLKLLEEPPAGVVFVMVSHEPQKLLSTIASRLQRVTVPGIPEEVLVDYLIAKEGIETEKAMKIGHLAQGNLYRALQLEQNGGEVHSQNDALQLLSLPLCRDPKVFLEYAQEVAKLDRPEVVALLDALPPALREVLALQYGDHDVQFLSSALGREAQAIAAALPLDNYSKVMEEIQSARMEVVQNGNVQMVVFDFLLTLITLYRR
ncbi:ATP-binding protein [Porphyromonas levii]|uniref:DNA polymerase III subunit n=1 Tax=Porphyromonas levii TaxID=28114 RepID=UPI000367A745|nr:DNA polymerase III subunit delta' [Porphyromonas levii]MBR8730054.1 hypothetical protein [Porphyromonas levii]MBR8802856.1 hypothetical protein [Porphyromonas levii]